MTPDLRERKVARGSVRVICKNILRTNYIRVFGSFGHRSEIISFFVVILFLLVVPSSI